MRYSSPVGAWLFLLALVAAAICAALSLTGFLSPDWAAACLLPLFIIIGVGVAFPASGVFARAILRGHADRGELALTFDDGPDPLLTPQILDLLDAGKHKATFFVIGERAERYPDLLREIVRRGHEIANHTWSHSYVTVFVPPKSLARQLERTNSLVARETGTRPRWFRAPVGLLSPRVVDAARLADLRLVSWTATGRDGVGRTSVESALARLEQALAPGAILVLHDGKTRDTANSNTCSILRTLVQQIDSRGLRSVTLSNLCGDR